MDSHRLRQSIFLAAPQKPKPTSTRHSAFLRATPKLPMSGWCGSAVAKAQLNRGAEAVAWLRRGLDANRSLSAAHFHRAAALARLGGLDQARAAVQAGLALDPTFTISRWRGPNIARSDDPTFLAGCERVIEGMRLVGVPEG